MSSLNQELQTHFFDKIKDVIPQNQSMVDEIADLLDISKDSVYRRIRNSTSLTLEEIVKLCSHYKVSFDLNPQQTASNVTFTYNTLKNQNDFKKYLTNILKDLKSIAKSSEKQVIYAAIDIPIFHHLQFPELAAFKMFYWLKGVISDPMLNGKRFNVKHIDPEFIELGKELYRYYQNIPSIELWTTETINSHMEQIQYFWESGLFESKEDALKICQITEEELLCLQQQADSGSKIIDGTGTEENSFKLYQSEIEIGNNCIITKRGQTNAVYLSFHLMNYMVTTNDQFCNQTLAWADTLIKKSVLISEVSEILRYKFFKQALEKNRKLMDQIDQDKK